MKKRGPPKGNKNATHDKPWTKALERALAQFNEGGIRSGAAIRRIADGVVRRAIAGDAIACREIAERLDGKPVQPVAGQIDTTLTVEILRFGANPTPK